MFSKQSLQIEKIFGGVMRIRDIISLFRQYLELGVALVLLLTLAFFLGYFLIYRKLCKGTRKFEFKRLGLYAVFVCYLVIIFGATMLSRGDGWQGNANLHLFYSYREAWNAFSATEWRNIILNILLFLPFGCLLPFVSKRFKAFWKTCFAGFALTLAIEVVQLVLKKGIFEVDDIFDNTLGAIIGYGCYRILMFTISIIKKKKDEKLLPVLCYQIPAIVIIGAFSIIFTAYNNQELGNLRSNYIFKINNVTVSSDIHYSADEADVSIYQLHVADEKETGEQAKEMFELFGLGIDNRRTDIYENSTIYYSDGGNRLSMWIEYAGNSYKYTDFDELFLEDTPEENANDNASEEEIRTALGTMNIILPEGMEFENVGDGEYTFTANQILSGTTLYDGTISCNYTKNKKISELNNSLIAFKEYKKFPIISEKEAFERMEEGMFNYPYADKVKIKVYGINLEYEIDSKGFYQPVYVFDVNIKDVDTTISIPAIQ